METKLKQKLTAIAIAQVFLLGSVQANAFDIDVEAEVYEKDFTALDNNEDGLIDSNEVLDDDIFEGMEDSDANERWDVVDINNDDLWDEKEYTHWREYEEMDANTDGLLDQKEVVDANVFDGVAEGIYTYRWNIADRNGDGVWNHREYMEYQTQFGT